MSARYIDTRVAVDAQRRLLRLSCRLGNDSRQTWRADGGFAIGWQVFDPAGGGFLSEGEWIPLAADVAPGASVPVEVPVELPAERGPYRVYISPIDPESGWEYDRGGPFIVLDAEVDAGGARLIRQRLTTLRRLRWENPHRTLARLFRLPAAAIWRNWGLIRSMTRRDILGRYRGSLGDALWTVLNPLLLMLTYFFVFGIVLQARFGSDPSRSGFVLYFLAGMLPWLAVSEAAGRAPSVILEHRNFVKKLVFPVEILPVAQTLAALVTQGFALLIFVLLLLAARGSVPATAFWLPVLIVPQVLLTVGLAWLLAATGAFVRDLGQMIGFLLTLWFFLTPICYPEASLPQWALPVLGKNPMFALVRGYRAIFLESHPPEFAALWKLWALGIALFLAGHAWFHKLRRAFADVV
jgi:lipopolysaccharide transport system permease protein